MELKQIIGTHLRELRESRGFSQKTMAEILKTNQSAITRYEQGICPPDPDTLLEYASYFKVSIDWIYGRTETKLEGTRLADLNEEIVEGSPLYERIVEVINKEANKNK